jgi:hypothetical protein
MPTNAIQRELTAEIIANQIRLERASTPSATVVLIEGGSDARLFKRFLNPAYVTLVVCFDRGKLERVLDLLVASGFAGLVAIADPDFDQILGILPTSANVCWTDNNDAETMILPTVIDKLLGEYGTQDRINANRAATGKDPIDILIEEASRLGATRLVNKRDSLGLKFEGMTYQFTSNTAVVIDMNKTISHLIGRSQTTVQASQLTELIDEAIAAYGSQPRMCQGHDMIRLLGRGVRRDWGSCAEFDSTTKCDDLEKIVRVAYEETDFNASGLFACLKAWETNNLPYRLF